MITPTAPSLITELTIDEILYMIFYILVRWGFLIEELVKYLILLEYKNFFESDAINWRNRNCLSSYAEKWLIFI